MNSFINQKFSTMNTRKLIFGLFAVAMLVAASASTAVADDHQTGIKKGKVVKGNK